MSRKIVKLAMLIVLTAVGVAGSIDAAFAQAPVNTSAKKALAKSYVFTLESFRIRRTRSVHEDTDYVTFALKVGSKVYKPQVKFMGDLNDGTYKVNLSFGPVRIPSTTTPVVMTYLIMNSGHDKNATQQSIKKVSEGLLDGASSTGGIYGKVAEVVRKYGIPIVFANCDGWVAGDRITMTGRTLAQWGRSHRETRNYPGTDSRWGCGSNSIYDVTWSVKQK